jgi:hypothetical protein
MDTEKIKHRRRSSKSEPTPGAQSAMLYGGCNDVRTSTESFTIGEPIRPMRRDRYGEPVYDIEPALPRSARIRRLQRESPVMLDKGELAYLEAFELAEAYRDHLDQLRAAIGDAEADRGLVR